VCCLLWRTRWRMLEGRAGRWRGEAAGSRLRCDLVQPTLWLRYLPISDPCRWIVNLSLHHQVECDEVGGIFRFVMFQRSMRFRSSLSPVGTLQPMEPGMDCFTTGTKYHTLLRYELYGQNCCLSCPKYITSELSTSSPFSTCAYTEDWYMR
jgi:hypothetical protein